MVYLLCIRIESVCIYIIWEERENENERERKRDIKESGVHPIMFGSNYSGSALLLVVRAQCLYSYSLKSHQLPLSSLPRLSSPRACPLPSSFFGIPNYLKIIQFSSISQDLLINTHFCIHVVVSLHALCLVCALISLC